MRRSPGTGSSSFAPALSAAMLLLAVLPAHAVSFLKTQELPELVAESTRAAMGRVVEVRHGFDENRLHSTWVTLAIEDALYGEVPGPGGELTFKVYGSPQPLEDGSRIFLDGTPLYAPGQRYLVLLIGESRWGFTNTAGLFQGAFLVEPGNRVRGLTTRHEVFGAAGLSGVNDGSDGRVEIEPRHGAAVPAGEPVSYTELRDAVTSLWTRGGGALHPNRREAAPVAPDRHRGDPSIPRGKAAPEVPR